MLNEFYNYIAKGIIRFFQIKGNSILPGERYCLRLDTEEMVQGVNEALKAISAINGIQGQYEYDAVYSTFTIKINGEKEIVIAAQINMTEHFLARLRNVRRTDKNFPILMITTQAVVNMETIMDAAADLSAKGMPFHVESLIDQIEINIKEAQLTEFDRATLKSDLDRKKKDRYNDKSSLYEYKELLAILERGYIKDDDYPQMELFPDPDGRNTIVDYNKAIERLQENHDIFESIDRAVKFEDIEEELSKKFDKPFVDHLVKRKRKGECWFKGYTLMQVKTSADKMQRKLDNPLEINDSDFEIYAGSPLEYRFEVGENAFIRSDGSSKSRQRKKNIIIYDVLNHEEIAVDIATNIAIKSGWIENEKADVLVYGKTVHISIKPDGCKFSKVIIKDIRNNIKFEIKICILSIDPNYLDRLRTAYRIYVSKQNPKSRIQVWDLMDELLINPGKNEEITVNLYNGGCYECNYNQTLHLKFNNEDTDIDTGYMDCSIKCGAVVVPIQILDEPIKPIELTGAEAFKRKNAVAKSIEYKDGNLVLGAEKYYARDQYRVSLEMENQFVTNGWVAINEDASGISELPLVIPRQVRDAYIKLVSELKNLRTLPSLAFYNGKLKDLAEEYVNSVLGEINKIQSGQTLSQEQNNLLLLGAVIKRYDDRIIKMSPLNPLNVMYQLELRKERMVGEIRNKLVERLSVLYLLPYLRDENKEIYCAVEQKHSPEWRIYAPLSEKRYQGSKNYVQRLVTEKIGHYRDNFSFLFSDIGNNFFCINLINMGDCREVLEGIVKFFADELAENKSLDDILHFIINIYSEESTYSVFSIIEDNKDVYKYVEGLDFLSVDDRNKSELKLLLTNNISCFYRNPKELKYEYAHLAFYEMPMSRDIGSGRADTIITGISLGGITSGIPSVLSAGWYKTGYGTKYASGNELINFATKLNAMVCVAFSGSSYEENTCIFTEIEKNQEAQQKKIYDSSNWVVFVDPKVDLSFFKKKSEPDPEMLIIHYSDQYTSASGYDDITVTKKSKQYNAIIKEQLAKKGVIASEEQVRDIINLFNAVNGSWMLKLITAKKLSGFADSNFSREKMSVLSAIKLCMAYYAHDQIVWIPISLEEMLRVSGGTGLSQKDGLLSARNLGFDQRPTSDDILLVGIEGPVNDIKIYLHPVEVKIGINPQSVIDKAINQVKNTYDSLWKSLWPEENKGAIETKLSRNFFMQLIIVCCEKMDLYKIYPDEDWNLVLDEYREELLNEKYVFSSNIDQYIGKGTVISFKTDCLNQSGKISNEVCLLEFPEKMGSSYMISSAKQIKEELENNNEDLPKRIQELYISSPGNAGSDFRLIEQEAMQREEEVHSRTVEAIGEVGSEENLVVSRDCEDDICILDEERDNDEKGIGVCFGTNITDGSALMWFPNDTSQLFHTNTGIIGTMGTGKTQFTKALITQVYKNQNKNVDSREIGILIFDYKGDYNESKEDFINATNAKVLKPYHLPFNPLSLTKSKVFKPLLPIHTANSFKDTISKVYGLGAKQQDALFQCMIETYKMSGIMPQDMNSWENEPPTFEQVFQRYANDEDIKKNDSLAAAMNKLHQFQIFESDASKTKSLFEILDGVVVIDLSGYDSDIQNLIVAITLDLFYSQMQAAGSSKMNGKYRQLTKLILVDEADNFMAEGFPTLKKILKEGREFGVGTILSTQFLNHFGTGDDDYSKYILTWVVHNVSDLKNNDVDFVFKTEQRSSESLRLFNDIKKLTIHHSIVKIGTDNPVYIKDKAFWQLIKENQI